MAGKDLAGKINVSDLRRRLGDLRQFASVRRIELDDGPERGVRALAFSSGGGLDLWVLSDRTMDIGPLTWRGHPIAWQSATGFRSAALTNVEGDSGLGFLRSFSGMLVTCGLDHIGVPQGGHPLHGRLPFTPARLLSYGEDWERDEPVLFCEGETDQVRHLGERLRLHRRIEVPVGDTSLRILDRVTNMGIAPQEQQILYHINFGWPALDAGSELTLDGKQLVPPFQPFPEGVERSTRIFPSGPGPRANCALTFPGLKARLNLSYDTATLPVLQVWQDPRPQHHVLALEPCTTDLGKDVKERKPVVLQPGESRNYLVEMSIGET